MKSPVLIFCKIEDVTLNGSGNIYLIISKDRKETSIETVRKLRELIGKDCSIIISEMV
jgi:hypothetical protein